MTVGITSSGARRDDLATTPPSRRFRRRSCRRCALSSSMIAAHHNATIMINPMRTPALSLRKSGMVVIMARSACCGHIRLTSVRRCGDRRYARSAVRERENGDVWIVELDHTAERKISDALRTQTDLHQHGKENDQHKHSRNRPLWRERRCVPYT